MMFWEILATIFSGFLLAGLVMPIRLFYKRAPKWIVPIAAGLGMIGFQVYTEYAWANDAIAKLPDQSIVVAKVEKHLVSPLVVCQTTGFSICGIR